MKCYEDITTVDNDWRESIVVKENVRELKQCISKNESTVLEDDYGDINIKNYDRFLTIKIRRMQDD